MATSKRLKPTRRSQRIWLWFDQYGEHPSVSGVKPKPIGTAWWGRVAKTTVCQRWCKRIFGFVPKQGEPPIELEMQRPVRVRGRGR